MSSYSLNSFIHYQPCRALSLSNYDTTINGKTFFNYRGKCCERDIFNKGFFLLFLEVCVALENLCDFPRFCLFASLLLSQVSSNCIHLDLTIVHNLLTSTSTRSWESYEVELLRDIFNLAFFACICIIFRFKFGAH